MNRKIAFVENIVVDPENGTVHGFLLKKSFLGKSKVIMMRDIREIYLDGITTNSPENIVDVNEVVKVKDILARDIFLLGSSVITENGKKLGSLINFVLETNLSIMVTLIVKRTFSQEKRIISAERILNILPGKVIIREAGGKRVDIQRKERVLEPILPV